MVLFGSKKAMFAEELDRLEKPCGLRCKNVLQRDEPTGEALGIFLMQELNREG